MGKIKAAWCDRAKALATGRRNRAQLERNSCLYSRDCSRCPCCVVETYDGATMTGPESLAAGLWPDDREARA